MTLRLATPADASAIATVIANSHAQFATDGWTLGDFSTSGVTTLLNDANVKGAVFLNASNVIQAVFLFRHTGNTVVGIIGAVDPAVAAASRLPRFWDVLRNVAAAHNAALIAIGQVRLNSATDNFLKTRIPNARSVPDQSNVANYIITMGALAAAPN